MAKTTTLLRAHYQNFKAFWGRLVGLLALDSAGAALEMVPPLFSILIFDYAFPQQSMTYLILGVVGGFVAYLLYFGTTSASEFINTKTDSQMTKALSSRLFKKVQSTPIPQLKDMPMGDVQLRIEDDADIVTGLLLNLPSHLIVAAAQLVIFFAIALWLDPWVTLLGVIAFPLYYWETHFYSKQLENAQEDVQKTKSQFLNNLHEKLYNIRTIQVFNRQAHEQKRLEELFQKQAKSTIRHKMISLYNAFSNSLILQVWTMFITGYLGWRVIWGGLSVGEMISLGIYLPMIQGPVSDLCRLYTQVRMGSVSLRRVHELECLPEESATVEGQAPPEPIATFKNEIEFKNVDFSHNDELKILDQVNFTIAANSLTAFVGPSGIGKSTLIHLLLKMYKQNSGEILFNGKSISEIDADQLRKNIGVVFQENALFSGTIRSNISYSSPHATDQEIQEAALRANANEFIEDLPDGYDSEVLPEGKNFSGGQRARLGLARALLRKPSILILDELTSSLDAEAAFMVEETLERLKHKMTIIMITHQLSATKMADRILFLDAGKIAEQGTFQELMDKKGKFFDLYNIQTGGFQEFSRRFEIELERHRRYQHDLSLVVLEPTEYQNWKAADRTGSLPKIMESIAKWIRRNTRVMDFCSVYAEHRIALALSATSGDKAEQVVNVLKEKMKKDGFRFGDKIMQTEFVTGIAECGKNQWEYSEHLFVEAETQVEVGGARYRKFPKKA